MTEDDNNIVEGAPEASNVTVLRPGADEIPEDVQPTKQAAPFMDISDSPENAPPLEERHYDDAMEAAMQQETEAEKEEHAGIPDSETGGEISLEEIEAAYRGCPAVEDLERDAMLVRTAAGLRARESQNKIEQALLDNPAMFNMDPDDDSDEESEASEEGDENSEESLDGSEDEDAEVDRLAQGASSQAVPPVQQNAEVPPPQMVTMTASGYVAQELGALIKGAICLPLVVANAISESITESRTRQKAVFLSGVRDKALLSANDEVAKLVNHVDVLEGTIEAGGEPGNIPALLTQARKASVAVDDAVKAGASAESLEPAREQLEDAAETLERLKEQSETLKALMEKIRAAFAAVFARLLGPSKQQAQVQAPTMA